MFRWQCIRIMIGVILSTCCLSVTSPVRGVTLRFGDILIADPDFVHIGWDEAIGHPDDDPMQPTVWRVNPYNGTRDVVTSETKGEGVPLRSVTGVVVDRLGRMTVADPYSRALLRVDPSTGDRTYLTNGSEGEGPFLQSVGALALNRDNSLVVLDHRSQSIFHVDADTGDRSLVSGPTRGAGPALSYGSTLSIDRLGRIWTTAFDTDLHSALLRIDPATGDREVISGWGVGTGLEFFGDIHDVEIVDGQTAFVVNLGRLYQIDLSNGNRTHIVTDGPRIETMFAIALSPDGSLLVADEYLGTMHQLDLSARRHALFSGNTPDWGPRMWTPQDIFIVIPEPTVVSQLTVAILLGWVLKRADKKTRHGAQHY